MDRKIIQKAGRYFTDEERHKIIQELISTQCTRASLWKKYTGEKEEHGYLIRWMEKLGYSTANWTRRPNNVSDLYLVKQNLPAGKAGKIKPDKAVKMSDESFETLQLKKRIAELERQLKDAELKAIAFSTMVDIAEKEFKIPIRKKLNTKP